VGGSMVESGLVFPDCELPAPFDFHLLLTCMFIIDSSSLPGIIVDAAYIIVTIFQTMKVPNFERRYGWKCDKK
jgi:hypothetical protein